MYWYHGQRILKAAELVRQRDDLEAVYVTNFGCGPDSFLLSYFARAMGERPYLEVEVDEHSSDAGVITRCEAFLDSLGSAQRAEGEPSAARRVLEHYSVERVVKSPPKEKEEAPRRKRKK